MQIDFLTPSEQPYPGADQTAPGRPCGSAPLAPPAQDGLWNQVFAPAQLDYPMPPCPPPAPTDPSSTASAATPPAQSGATCPCATTPPAPVAPQPAPASPTAPASPAPSATPSVLAPIAPPAPTAPAQTAPAQQAPQQPVQSPAVPVQSSPQSPAQPAPQQPAPTVPVPPSPQSPAQPAPQQPAATVPAPAPQQPPPVPDTMLRGYSLNPKFKPARGLHPPADRGAVTRDAAPVLFTVPDGCDSVDLSYGPVELNPGVGQDGDQDVVIAIAGARLDGGGAGPLSPGSSVGVIVSWRAAGSTDLAASHLRAAVYARFSSSTGG